MEDVLVEDEDPENTFFRMFFQNLTLIVAYLKCEYLDIFKTETKFSGAAQLFSVNNLFIFPLRVCLVCD